MDITKASLAFLLIFTVTACSVQSERKNVSIAYGNGPMSTLSSHNSVMTKRINTTECQDSDDWYLDGYRVGKSFSTQKTQMLQQRMGFCRLSLETLPQQFKSNWERGFAVGNNENSKIRNKQNRQVRKKV